MATLDSGEIREFSDFAIQTVREAGAEALKFYGKGDPNVKFDEDLVTEAEVRISNMFREKLEDKFPGHALFGDTAPGEAYQHGEKRFVWIHDALDGIANFQAGIPIWGISLALFENFWPIFGVFYMPVTDDLFYGQAGQSAYWGEQVVRIPDTGEISNESVLLTYSRFHNHYRSTFPGKIRNLGSTGAHVCYVARGRAEAALLAHVSYQDLAAAQIILGAAGGRIYKMDGSEFHLGEYLSGQRIEEHLIAVRQGAHSSIKFYLQE